MNLTSLVLQIELCVCAFITGLFNFAQGSSSTFIQVTACVRICSIVYVCHILYPPINKHSSIFHCRTILNTIAANVGIKISVRSLVLIANGIYRGELLDHMSILFNFLYNHQMVFLSSYLGLNFFTSSPTFAFWLLIKSHPRVWMTFFKTNSKC